MPFLNHFGVILKIYIETGQISIMQWEIIEFAAVWTLVAWILIATYKGFKKANPQKTPLMRGVWKLEMALGLALCGLAAFGTITSLYFPYNLGPATLVLTFGVFIHAYRATKELEKK